MNTTKTVREIELEPYGTIHGVTCDADGNVWFSHSEGNLVCVEPETGRVLRTFENMDAQAGTTFDGTHLWQITSDSIVRIDPKNGNIVHTLPYPKGIHCSGMAYADGSLWIGDFAGRGVVRIDAETGEIQKRLESDRFVTGVTWSEGELWYGAWEDESDDKTSSLRRVDPGNGEVLEERSIAGAGGVSGIGSDRTGRFWCGGGYAGGIRAVQKDDA